MSKRLVDAAVAEVAKVKGFESVGGDEDKTGSIAVIIAALIPVIIDLIKGCSSDDNTAAATARKPGLLQKWRLRREVKKLVPDDDDESKAVRDALFNSVMTAGKTAVAADFRETVGTAAE